MGKQSEFYIHLLLCKESFVTCRGVARHWRNPVCTRVTSLDSSDALYIVYLAYTVI